MSVYVLVSNKIFSVQHGLFPLTKQDYPNFPFTCSTSASSLRSESFHLAVGNLRCFDATKNTEYKKPYFNWFDRDNTFIAGVRKAPQYTDFFWYMFLKVAANIGDVGKSIVEATTPAEIERLRSMKIKVVKLDGSEYITEEVPILST